MNTHLWSDDHYVTQMNPDGSIRDFIDYDSNLIATAAGVPSASQAALLLRRVDGGRCTHGRATFVSEKYYGPHDTTNGNIGDSWCDPRHFPHRINVTLCAGVRWRETVRSPHHSVSMVLLHFQPQAGSTLSPGSKLTTLPPSRACCCSHWQTMCAAGRGCTSATFATAPSSPTGRGRTLPSSCFMSILLCQTPLCNSYFEYPAVAALMTSVLKYGVQYGLQASLSLPPRRLHACNTRAPGLHRQPPVIPPHKLHVPLGHRLRQILLPAHRHPTAARSRRHRRLPLLFRRCGHPAFASRVSPTGSSRACYLCFIWF
jgi:hypothetical protein